MRITVSLPDQDVAFLNAYARRLGGRSRSAVIQRAVQLLRASELGAAYAEAWNEWGARGDAEVWEPVVADGLERSP